MAGTKRRLLRLQRLLMEQPYRFTMKELCERLDVDRSTIMRDFNEFEIADYVVDRDDKNRYAFKVEKPYTQLKNLLHFTEEDQLLLSKAIDTISPHSKRGMRLKEKLSSLYDYKKLGHAYLKPKYLSKIDTIRKAINEKRCVSLVNYQSSSSVEISDRLLEVYHISPSEDRIQAYDRDNNALRVFRLFRCEKVEICEEPWKYKPQHRIMHSDAFRIINEEKVEVHIKLNLEGYNHLVENYPLTTTSIESTEEGVYELKCEVNADFYGLGNFILGFHYGILEIVSPAALRKHIVEQIEKIEEDLVS